MVMVNSRTLELLDELEVRTVLGPRGGPHPLRPRALPHGADDPLSLTGVGRAAGARRPAAARRQATRCSSGSARRSCPATGRPRSSPATRSPPAARCSCWRAACPSRKLDLDAFMRQATEYEDVGLGLGPRQPPARRARPDPLLPRAPRQGGHDLGALGRLRPHHGRRLHARATRRPTRARRPATPSTSTRSASAASSRTPGRGWTRPATAWPARPTSCRIGCARSSRATRRRLRSPARSARPSRPARSP